MTECKTEVTLTWMPKVRVVGGLGIHRFHYAVSGVQWPAHLEFTLETNIRGLRQTFSSKSFILLLDTGLKADSHGYNGIIMVLYDQ